MKRAAAIIVATVAAGLLAGSSSGQSVALTAKAGTLGLGADVTVGAGGKLNLRVGVNGFAFDTEREQDEGVIKAELDWLTFGALVDYHPWAGGFRITGGAMINNNEIALSATPNDTIELNGVEFGLESLDGEITFDDVAPYVGIGYGNAVSGDGRWHFACDFGVMFQGEPSVTASAVSSVPGLQDVVDAALDAEVNDIEDDASSINAFPVISAGISFRF